MDTLDDLSNAIQNYVVAPLNAFGLGGYLFDAQGESLANLSADITDHYSEDNRALQDHIAIRPTRITLKGYVGELVYGNTDATTGIIATLTQKLTEINAFLPVLSAAATQAQQAIQQPSESNLTLSSVADLYGTIRNFLPALGKEAKQANAYLYFKSCMQQGILMGVQTPWEFMTNMAVESIVALQPENTISISDFSITFKQIRIASTATTAYAGATAQGAAAQQGAPTTNLGLVQGAALPSSSLPGAQALMAGPSSIPLISTLKNVFSGN